METFGVAPIDDARRNLLAELEAALAYRFKDLTLLNVALTHKSYIEEWRSEDEASQRADQGQPGPVQHYENLEFLGDAVLQLAVTHIIMTKFSYAAEGVLSKLRSQLVSEESLHDKSLGYGFGRFLLLGRGEETTQGREKKSILADVYESIIGAVYLDGGFAASFKIVERDFEAWLTQLPDRLRVEAFSTDFKSLLQELCQKRWKTIPVYTTTYEWGPDHDKTFRVEVSLNSRPLGEGEGKSKKAAEQLAAQRAMEAMRGESASP